MMKVMNKQTKALSLTAGEEVGMVSSKLLDYHGGERYTNSNESPQIYCLPKFFKRDRKIDKYM